MFIYVGSATAALVILLQWLVVSSLIENTYATALKSGALTPSTISFYASVALSVASLFATLFAAWAFDKLKTNNLASRFVPLLISITGSSSLLVFWGLVGISYVVLVNR